MPNAINRNYSFGAVRALLTFLMICLTWVFFRSGTFSDAWQLLMGMFGRVQSGAPLLTTIAIVKVFVIIPLMLMFHWIMRNTNVITAASKLPWWVVSIAWSVMLILIILSQQTGKSFIYFQF
jgi:hypothetical protein